MPLSDERQAVIGRTLSDCSCEVLPHAIAAVKALLQNDAVSEPIRQALLAVATRDNVPLEVRFAAIATIPGPPAKLDAKRVALVMRGLDPKQPLEVRSAAADALAKTALDAEQWIELTDVVRKAGPLDVARVLDVFGRDRDPRIGQALIGAIEKSPGRRALREEGVREKLKPFGAEVLQTAEPLFALLRADHAEQLSRLLAAEKSLPAGDVRRGHVVFHGAKANCAACHQLGYGGGNLGPDLSRIGAVRTKRDLLESILFPSASFVRSYEPTALVLADGRVLNGLVKTDSAAEVVLAINHKDLVRVPRADIDTIRPSNVSVMPAGLEQSLTKQELADLLAFLQAAK
jgi:putative heme-binding domain-containing protein